MSNFIPNKSLISDKFSNNNILDVSFLNIQNNNENIQLVNFDAN